MKRIGTIICSLVISFVCLAQDSADHDVPENKRSRRQVVITTDKNVYWPGEEITVTLRNSSSKPLYYTDPCDVSLCWYVRDDWMCEVTDCEGETVTLQPGSSRVIRLEGFISVGRYRYKWLFKTDLSGDTSGVTVFSDEFDVQMVIQPDFE